MGLVSSHLQSLSSVTESGNETPLSILENVGFDIPTSLQATSIEIFLLLRRAATSALNLTVLIIFTMFQQRYKFLTK